MQANLRGWTLDGMIDARQFARVLQAAHHELAAFADENGAVSFPIRAHLLMASK
jgi:hypothetical protein